MRDDLRPQIAPKPPQYGRTSASKCHPPCRADMPTRSLQGHTRATAVTPALRTTTQLASPLAPPPGHTLPVLQITHSSLPPSTTANPIPHPLAPQPTHHNPHFTTTNPFPSPVPAHTPHQHPIGQPHNPTQTPSGQADSALQTEYTHKLPVVRSQDAESALLPGAAVHQRHGKGTPMARQSRYFWGF